LSSLPEEDYRFPIKYFSRNICLLIRKEKLEPRALSIADEPSQAALEDKTEPKRRLKNAVRHGGHAGGQDARPEEESD